MKRSKVFYLAQISVLRDQELSYAEKLELIQELAQEEELAKSYEKLTEEKRKEKENDA